MGEEPPDIQLFNETDLDLPINADQVRSLARLISRHEQVAFSLLEVVFVDEQTIVSLNREHLDRDYVTDIISFRYDDQEPSAIEGTLYCCAPRIREQASEFNEPEDREFSRIVIHGMLHLAGFDDQTDTARRRMTEKEESYLEKMESAE